MIVEDVMTAEPVTVTPSATVKHALELLDRHHVTSLPVVEGHRLCGVVSEADLIRDLVAHDPRTQLRPFEDSGDLPVSVADVMTRHAVTVHPDTDLAVAVDLMTSTAIKSVPVVDRHDHLRGMLSRSDVVRCYAKTDGTLAQNVHDALASVGLGDWLVEVHDGVAEVVGADDAADADLDLARVIISTVPGVVDVRAG